jgi:hypothetical protein
VSGNPVDDLQQEFPRYRIWQEITGAREPRYVAQARDLRVRPHTLVTADPAELRAELAAAPAHWPPPLGAAGRQRG